MVQNLSTDPSPVIELIIRNNPNAVAAKLAAAGYDVNTPDEIAAALNSIIKKHGPAGIISFLSVPVITGNLTQADKQFLQQVPTKRSNSAEGGGSGAGWDFAGVLVQTLGNVAGTYFYSQGNQPGEGGSGNTQYVPMPQNNNTVLYVVLAVVAVGVILFFVLRKKS